MVSLLLAVAAAQAASPVKMNSCEVQGRAWDAALAAKFPHERATYRMRLTGYASLCHGWVVVDLVHGSAAGLSDGVRWAVRRQRMGIVGQPTTEWLDSTRCPALYDWLERLDQIPVAIGLGPYVRPPKPGPMPTPPPPPPEDGTSYQLRDKAVQPDGSYADVELSSSYGALQRWAEREITALDGCWRPSPDA